MPRRDRIRQVKALWLACPLLYSLPSRGRDWSAKRYERWLADLFCAQLLPSRAEQSL